ncbi:hypothetical protein QTG56_22635 (plasmid) [Rossellomorea sp. AcN35-11]|nr:hypothetical protein [Rossellomorea aquimaris]WJV32171.1 hypothetical protein QTG56_22635 [Rossellomorea sp. AcN35-11]
MLSELKEMKIRTKLILVVLLLSFIGGTVASMIMQFNHVRSWLNPLYHYGSLFSFAVLCGVYIQLKINISLKEGEKVDD